MLLRYGRRIAIDTRGVGRLQPDSERAGRRSGTVCLPGIAQKQQSPRPLARWRIMPCSNSANVAGMWRRAGRFYQPPRSPVLLIRLSPLWSGAAMVVRPRSPRVGLPAP